MSTKQAVSIEAPASTFHFVEVDHDRIQCASPNIDVYDWLVDNHIAWTLLTNYYGTVKFIFTEEQHAVLFLLRWS